MKLFNLDPSPYASRVRMQIYAKGLDVEIENIAWPPSAEYRAKTGTGRVPALEADAGVLPESMVICEYLEDLGKGPSLRPVDPFERATMRLLVQLVDQFLMPHLVVLIRQFLGGTRDETLIKPALKGVANALPMLDARISGGKYAVGGALSLADCALVPHLFYTLTFCGMFGNTEPFRDTGRLARYFDAIRTEPAAAKVLGEMEAAFKAHG